MFLALLLGTKSARGSMASPSTELGKGQVCKEDGENKELREWENPEKRN